MNSCPALPFDQLWQAQGSRNIDEERSFWDGRADEFNDITRTADREGRQELLDALASRGALRKGARVLDLGCGAGRFALEFARLGCLVTALDISPRMIAFAKANAEEQGLEGIRFLTLPWQELDLAAHNFERAFDLVFANRSPAVNSAQSLLKMHAASRGHCFLNAFIERRDLLLEALVARLLPNLTVPPFGGDIWYAFNILWQHGLHPDLLCRRSAWTRLWQVDKALEEYTRQLARLAPETPNLKKALARELAAMAEQSVLKREVRAKTAWMFWKVPEE